jgi:hypothetical protein
MENCDNYGQDHLPPVIPENEPWKPFQFCLDFEVAELVLEAALNRSQADRLIKLINHAAENNDFDPFTLKSGSNMNKCWDGASMLCIKVRLLPWSLPIVP